jgi:hypothetical protein
MINVKVSFMLSLIRKHKICKPNFIYLHILNFQALNGYTRQRRKKRKRKRIGEAERRLFNLVPLFPPYWKRS